MAGGLGDSAGVIKCILFLTCKSLQMTCAQVVTMGEAINTRMNYVVCHDDHATVQLPGCSAAPLQMCMLLVIDILT